MTEREALERAELLRNALLHKNDVKVMLNETNSEWLDKIVKEVKYRVPVKQKGLNDPEGHLWVDDWSSVICRTTNKKIRYPLGAADELEFCPKCGQAIAWR